MNRLDVPRPVPDRAGLTRRDFLQAGALGLGVSALSAGAWGATATRDRDLHVILLLLVGGPSQLDTWDPKPDAPAEIRGPFRSIATKVPGVRVTELFPRLAGMLDKVALVRSVHHDATAVHDFGHQALQTGRLFEDGIEHPHFGSVLAMRQGSKAGAPPFVVLPRAIGVTGGNQPHGQSAGYLGTDFDPCLLAFDHDRATAGSGE